MLLRLASVALLAGGAAAACNVCLGGGPPGNPSANVGGEGGIYCQYYYDNVAAITPAQCAMVQLPENQELCGCAAVTMPIAAETPAPAALPVDVATSSPTVTPVAMTTASPTITPVDMTTTSPTALPVAMTTNSPTALPVAMATSSPTASTMAPVVTPVVESTPVPTATPVVMITTSPTVTPVASATSAPTVAFTASPSSLGLVSSAPIELAAPVSAPSDFVLTLAPVEEQTSLPTVGEAAAGSAAPVGAPSVGSTAPVGAPSVGSTAPVGAPSVGSTAPVGESPSTESPVGMTTAPITVIATPAPTAVGAPTVPTPAAPVPEGTSTAPTPVGTPTAPVQDGTPTAPTPVGTPTAPVQDGTPTVPTPVGTPTAPVQGGASSAPTSVGTPTAPVQGGTPTAPTPVGTPTAPVQVGTPTAPSTPGNVAPTCTGFNEDPYQFYGNGTYIECCETVDECLDDWNKNGRVYYRCIEKGTCPDNYIDEKPEVPPPICTGLNEDPYQLYGNSTIVPCCNPTKQCLNTWDGDQRTYYKCVDECFPNPIPPPVCTYQDQDPFQYFGNGTENFCCNGLGRCLDDWNNNNRFYFRCLPCCADVCMDDMKPSPTSNATGIRAEELVEYVPSDELGVYVKKSSIELTSGAVSTMASVWGLVVVAILCVQWQ